MKFFRQGPLFFLIILTGVLFTLFAVLGKNNIYDKQEYHPLKAPLLSVVFTGMNDDIYPWQIFAGDNDTVKATAAVNPSQESEQEETVESSQADTPVITPGSSKEADTKKPAEESTPAPVPTPVPTPTPTPTPFVAYGEGRPTPLRESTRDEYLNHISADIYGDVGVINASSYPFVTVGEDYFDDALFIGDSRTVGLRDYTDLSEHADFYCETSLTIYKVLEEEFKGLGNVKDALAKKDYGKIYLMVGINELGRGTTEDFMSKYTEVVDTLHELKPDAKIIIQGIMRVTGKKNESDATFNNHNINARNNAIATLADNEHIFYIDVNEVVCDEEGNLSDDYTYDQIHLLGMYNDLWKQFLLEHGIEL